MSRLPIDGTVVRIMVWRHSMISDAAELLFVQSRRLVARGQWELPGGQQEWSELSHEAAVRELKEETNLELTEAAKLVSYQRRTPFNNAWRYVIFEARRFLGQVAVVRPDEIAAFAWHTPTNLPPLDEHTTYLFERHRKKLQLDR